MGTFLVFILNRFIFRISEFIWHWYVGAAKIYGHFAISIFEKLDGSFALKITIRHLFEPLYQDRTVLGYILGFPLRMLRLIIGGIFYAIMAILFLAGYLLWAAVPLILILKAVNYKW